MRTTLTIEDALLRQLKRRAAELGLPLKELVARVLQAGLQALDRPSRPRMKPVPTFHMGAPRFDLDKAHRIAGELQDEEIARKVALRK
jgi:hypothetical protein